MEGCSLSGVEQYDYIISGAGAAGLSLAYHLGRAGLGDKRILLIDRERKTHNDRTWCFWEQGENPFEAVVYRRWGRLAFHGEGISQVLGIAPYAYKMIRGIDFYQFMEDWLAGQPQIQRLYGQVQQVGDTGVQVDGTLYTAQWIFNSVQLHGPPRLPQYHYLLQHFKGWVIESPAPVFDPEVATFMDFRIPQQGDLRFVYVLPFDATRALVEYTVFSAELLNQEDYDQGLRGYIREWLGLSDYRITHQEFGVIPMTDAPFMQNQGRLVHIGTAGGRTKPSSGYTFLRIQEQCRAIAKALAQGKAPPQPKTGRFGFYDSVLLNVLAKHRYPGRRAFSDFFRRNPAPMVLKFLDEATTPLEEVRVLLSMNIPAFSLAALEVIVGRAGLKPG